MLKFIKMLSLIISVAILFQFNLISVYSEDKCTCNTTTGEHSESCPLSKNKIEKHYTVSVRNFTEFVEALNNDEVTNIELLQNICISDTIKINKDLVIEGNGYSVSYGNFDVFSLERVKDENENMPIILLDGDIDVNIYNLKIIGGHTDNKVTSGINKNSSGLLGLYNVVIENCFSKDGGSALNCKRGTIIMKDCNINKNISNKNASAILNNGVMILDGCSITENVSFCDDKAFGSSIELSKNSKLYINNSTIAKNVSLENGGGINVDEGELYALNTNIIGNVALNSGGEFYSSGIHFNNSKGELLNNIIIGNYSYKSDDDFEISDISADKSSEINAYYNCYTGKNKIVSKKTNKRSKKDINTLIATESVTDFSNLTTDDKYKDVKLLLPMFVKLPNDTNVVGVKSDTEFMDGCKTVFDYDDLNNIICGYLKKDKLVYVSGKEDYNMKVVTKVQGGGPRPNKLCGSTLYDTLIDNNILAVSVPETKGGYVLKYDSFAMTINKNDVITLTAVPYNGYEFTSWNLEDKNTELIDCVLTDQTISVSSLNNIKINPVFKKTDKKDPKIVLINDYKNSFSFKAKENGTFSIEPNMIKVQDNKILTGFNTKPDGSGESYLLGKTYKTKDNLVLYAMDCEIGYSFVTGHTIPNADVFLFGRDNYYLGHGNSGENGDYVLKSIIPSYDQKLIIKNQRGTVILQNIIETEPITEEYISSLKSSISELEEDENEDVIQKDDEKVEDKIEEEEQIPEEQAKDTEDTQVDEEPLNKDQEEVTEEENIDEEQSKKIGVSTPNKHDTEDTEDQTNINKVNDVIDELNHLVSSDVSSDWLPDIRENKSEIKNLKNSFFKLTENEKDMLAQDQLDEIDNYVYSLSLINGE